MVYFFTDQGAWWWGVGDPDDLSSLNEERGPFDTYESAVYDYHHRRPLLQLVKGSK